MKRTLICLLAAAAQLGAVTFATNRVNTTVTQTTGTRGELVQLIEPVLTGVGWSVVSGGGSTDVVLQSADPAGAIPAIRLRIYDPGSGNCTRFAFRNVGGTLTSNDLYLLPAAAKVWRIIANEYQFFIFNTSASTITRNWVAGGIPAVPSFLTPSEVWWGQGDAQSDTDTVQHETFRTTLGAYGNGYGPGGSGGRHACNYNGVLLEGNPGAATDQGQMAIAAPYNSNVAGSSNVHLTFPDNSQMVSDSWLGWGVGGVMSTSPLRIVGTIYDAIVVSANLSADTTLTFNGNNYYVLTVGVAGGTASGGNPGVLAVRIP